MKKPVKAKPEGYFTLTPALIVRDVDAAVKYYTETFGAQKHFSMPGPDGKTMHAELQLGDSIFMIGAEMPEMGAKSPETLGGTPASLTYFVEDSDAVFNKAVAAGAKVKMPIADQFWGDRYGLVTDPFGHVWGIATHKEELTPEQMQERAKIAMAPPKKTKGKKGKGKAEAPKWEPGTPAESYIPEGYHTLTPGFTVKDASAAIEFYKEALGATEKMRMPGPDGRILHAELQIGDSLLMISDEYPEMGAKSAATLGGSPFSLMVYVDDVDAAFDNAVKAGAKVKQPVQDMFWGDRYGEIQDPAGNLWGLATHKEDLTPEEINARMQKQFGGAQKQQ